MIAPIYLLAMIKFNIFDFVKYTKLNRGKFINYCEIIMDPFGNIILAIPSHTEAVVRYVMEKENKSIDDIRNEIPTNCSPLTWCIDKYGLIAIWYCGYMHGTYKYKRPNRFQRRSLDILINNGLITEEYIESCREYSLYLKRKSMGLEK